MSSLRQKLLAPACCVLVFGGIAIQRSTQVTAATAEPYHAAAAAAVNAVPRTFVAADGVRWTSKEIALPASAVQLLRPNALLCRAYEPADADPTQFHHEPTQLMIVQCRDSRDMQGHYPHNCYPNTGWTERACVRHVFDITGPDGHGGTATLSIPCSEYTFTTLDGARVRQWCVYNFLIVPGTGPGRGITPTIDAVVKAAEDYQQRHYGAAQYQVICDATLPQPDRERIFRTLVGMTTPTILTLQGKGQL